jgi:hypothetical protein
MLPTPRLSRSSVSATIFDAALKKKTAARIADLDGDSVASICLAATAAEDDADGIEDRRLDESTSTNPTERAFSRPNCVVCE